MPLRGEGWSKKSFQAFDKGPIEWEEFRRCSWPEEVEGEREKRASKERKNLNKKQSGD